jgi:hypothetical protein
MQLGGEVVAKAVLGLAPCGVEAADSKWLQMLSLENKRKRKKSHSE